MNTKDHQIEKLFLSNVSHRVRTPLNSVIGFSKLMLESDLSRNQVMEFTKRILDSGYDILNYFENLMILSEIESGMIQVNPVKFSIDPFLSGVIGEYNERFSDTGKIFIHREHNSSNPDFIMNTDEYLFKQIVLNSFQLIQNSILEGQILVGYVPDENSVTLRVKTWNCSYKKDISEENPETMYLQDYDSQDYLLMKTLNHLLSILNGKLKIHFSKKKQLVFSITLINKLVRITA